MPDLGNLQMLDVALGLAFMYFLLSIICSSIAEIIASLFRIRAKNLEAGIRTLLGSKEASDEFFKNWRIASLQTPKWFGGEPKEPNEGKPVGAPKPLRKPSYMPSRTFALAVMDTLAPGTAKDVVAADPKQQGSGDVLAKLDKKLAELKIKGPAEQRIKGIIDGAREETSDVRKRVDKFRAHLEDAFNDTMDRATGWYKRKLQVILFLVALVVAGGLNADTINVAERLAKDDALRARVVAQAQKAGKAAPVDSQTTPTATDVETQIKQARATGLPLGWSGENTPDGGSLGPWLRDVGIKAVGLLLTAFALMLGAPFWFDVLGKFARLRSTGNRIGTPKDDENAPSDRDEPPQRGGGAGTAPPPPISETV